MLARYRSTCLAAALVLVCSGTGGGSLAHEQRQATPDGTSRLYEVVLRELVYPPGRVPKALVVQESPIAFRAGGTWQLVMRDIPPELKQKVTTEAPAGGVRLDKESLPPNARLVTQAEIDKVFEKRDRKGWERFAKRFPGAPGFVAFSLPLFTADRCDALLYYQYSCGDLCGIGEYVWLHRSAPTERWVVRSHAVAIMS